jgi:pimeloyl-ACP methyl ester carboxylesterase
VEYGLEQLIGSLGVRLITYDRPGYGGSTRQLGRRVADCVDDTLAIADAIGVDRFAIEGTSSGAHHALAVAALAPRRVVRAAGVAPMAPYVDLGHDEWSRDQAPEVREYVRACLDGVDRMVTVFRSEDEQMRHDAIPGEARFADVFEQTRNGLWGWIDDELAAFQPWGFDIADISVPVALWHDPNDPVLPSQHAAWLARKIPDVTVVRTESLGHGSTGDPRADWTQLYTWLTEVR